MNKSDSVLTERAASAFEEIEERVRNAIDRINGVAARLEERNDRLFGSAPQDSRAVDPHTMPPGAVYSIFHLLGELHSALDRADQQIERQGVLV